MLLQPFGPEYPRELGLAVAKFRRAAAQAGSVSAMDCASRRAYAEALEKAILAKQRSELQREVAAPACHCASGTPHNDGAKIAAALRARHAAQLQAYPAKERKARQPDEWKSMYKAAMAAKRKQRV